MKSIRRSFMYVFATICGLTLGGNALLAADEMMAKGMVKGNLVVSGNVEVNLNTTTNNLKSSGGMKSTVTSKLDGVNSYSKPLPIWATCTSGDEVLSRQIKQELLLVEITTFKWAVRLGYHHRTKRW